MEAWESLTVIPFGAAVNYPDITKLIGIPGATCVVGTAVGKNPILLIIPCHRVKRKMGKSGQYSGGQERKMAIMAWESARRTTNELS